MQTCICFHLLLDVQLKENLNLTLHARTRQVNNLFQDLQNRFPYLVGWGWVQSDFGVVLLREQLFKLFTKKLYTKGLLT